MNSILWIVTYGSSTLFHARDNVITEFCDYYLAFLCPLYMTYISLVRTLWITNKQTLKKLAIPFIVVFLYFAYQMGFVSFDYAWHMKMSVFFIFSSFFIWLAWSIKHFKELPQCKWVLSFYIAIFLFSPLELFDFQPLFGYFDAHSLWHGVGSPIIALFSFFTIFDAQFYHNPTRKMV
ncbi:post-gpi attachment to protein factor 3 [Anaeramoeba ignava]|uniref:Post-GPI attachment to proteins factor 3 n=1 Tax=Anaeramoeba ignava TaxID=1746090 RepID=A0A9Q0REA5_ANAIG|nr:post-gpi attachment to protein factor 3 [Anaeramoeba ignava]